MSLITNIAFASAILPLALGSAGCDKGATPASSASASSSSRAAPPDRCVALPRDERPPNPDATRATNSDGTLKRLPPGPRGQRGHTVLFRYSDFGPQAMQNGLLGFEWWSWEPGGSFEHDDEFDIRVVVYQKLPRKKVEADYPTSRGKSDYRLIERDAALAYLDEKLNELATMDPDDPYDWAPLRRRLEQTRRTITTCLPQ